MNGLDWVFSAVLALVFLVVGVLHAFYYEQAKKARKKIAGIGASMQKPLETKKEGAEEILRGVQAGFSAT